MTPRARWSCVWLTWAGAFAVAETIALRSRHPDAPLSSHLRAVLGIRRRPLHARAGQAAFVGGAVWLYAHLYGREQSRESTLGTACGGGKQNRRFAQ